MASMSSPLLSLLVCCARQAPAAALHAQRGSSESATGSLWPAHSQSQPASVIAAMVERLVVRQDASSSTPELASFRDLQIAAIGMLLASISFVLAGVLLRPDTSPIRDRTDSEGSGAAPESPQPVHQLSPFRIWAMTALQFGYGFGLALQGLVVSPLEAKRLWPSSSSIALGGIIALSGLSQIVGPEAGHWSDQWRSRLGRRRPLIIIFSCGLACLTFALWLCSLLQFRWLYLAIFFVQQVVWNVVASTQLGLVPDLVVPEQRGFAGGSSAGNVLVGAFVAFLAVIALSTWDYHVHYGILVAVFSLTAAIVCVSAKEDSSLARRPDRRDRESPWTRMRQRYSLDIQKYPDFALLLVTKTLYCAAAMVKGFLLFFAEDMFRLPGESEEQALTARMAIMAELSAALAAFAAMTVLDGSLRRSEGDVEAGGRFSVQGMRLGTTARSILALGVGQLWMGLLWFGPIWVGWRIEKEFPRGGTPAVDEWGSFMVWSVTLWGCGQGLYLAGDQALSFALVPNQEEAARYLSLNSVCAFIGSTVGGVACGGLLTVFGTNPKQAQAYAFEGYVAIFLGASMVGIIVWGIAVHMLVRELKGKAVS